MVSFRHVCLSAAMALASLSETAVGQGARPLPVQFPLERAADASEFPGLRDATIDELAQGLEDKLFTSVDLVKAYIARIEEVNSDLHAVAEINPDALDIAIALDAEREAGQVRGPLHGLPILLKNNIATADKMNNTAGSFALLGAKVPRDSFVAQKLREAGAVLLGKANLSQWANFRSGNSSNGWSAHGGQVLGAYIANQDPSGSSSGCGVASDLGLAVACIGTETDGSIVSPASHNNIVGFKPTIGLTSRDLVIPISEHQDTIGPMARTVKDAAYLLQAMAGRDDNDPYTADIPDDGAVPDYLAALDPDALAGARLGIPSAVFERFGWTDPDFPELYSFYIAFDVLRIAGATIVTAAFPNATDPSVDYDAETRVLHADFAPNLAAYLAQLTENPAGVRSLEDVRAFTRTHPAEEYPDRDTAIWDDALEGLGYDNTDPRFLDDLDALRGLGRDFLLAALERDDLDALILPTALASGWAAMAAAPLVTVPMGFWPEGDEGDAGEGRRGLVWYGPNVPLGLSFLGPRFSEEKLLGLAYAYEQRTKNRAKTEPLIMPRTELADCVGRDVCRKPRKRDCAKKSRV